MRARFQQIKLDRVSRVFGRSYALNRVSTTFRAGTLVALLGPNGAGKSTLLSLVATLQVPDRGEIRYDDRSHRDVMRSDRGAFGYVSHDALLYLDLTGRENLDFYASLYGGDAPGRIGELLESVGLTDAADRVVRGYSRGMRQRLSIARALLQRPSVLLLDEPFTGLDKWGERALYDVLSGERDAGRIVLLSTHRLTVPSGLCDEVRVLRRGRLLTDRVLEDDESIASVYAAAFGESTTSTGPEVS